MVFNTTFNNISVISLQSVILVEEYPNMFTVLFFDEANTTEAIGVIKEIMCDKSLCGNPIQIHERLKIIWKDDCNTCWDN
jgi:hypothetical protein